MYAHRGMFRIKLDIYDGAFSLWLSHISKTYLIAFRFHFSHNSPFREKTCHSENFRRKSLLLTKEHFYFSKFETMQWNGVVNEEGFLN